MLAHCCLLSNKCLHPEYFVEAHFPSLQWPEWSRCGRRRRDKCPCANKWHTATDLSAFHDNSNVRGGHPYSSLRSQPIYGGPKWRHQKTQNRWLWYRFVHINRQLVSVRTSIIRGGHWKLYLSLELGAYCSSVLWRIYRCPWHDIMVMRVWSCRAGSAKRSSVRPSICPSVCPSVPSFDRHRGVRRVCCWAPCGRELSIDRLRQRRPPGAQQQRRRSTGCSTTLSSKCEQCHVESWRRKLKMDLSISCLQLFFDTLKMTRRSTSRASTRRTDV